MTHWCPDCGLFSWHGPDARAWAITCPHCGHIHPQHPHPPADAPKPARASRTRKRATKKAAEVVVDEARDDES